MNGIGKSLLCLLGVAILALCAGIPRPEPSAQEVVAVVMPESSVEMPTQQVTTAAARVSSASPDVAEHVRSTQSNIVERIAEYLPQFVRGDTQELALAPEEETPEPTQVEAPSVAAVADAVDDMIADEELELLLDEGRRDLIAAAPVVSAAQAQVRTTQTRKSSSASTNHNADDAAPESLAKLAGVMAPSPAKGAALFSSNTQASVVENNQAESAHEKITVQDNERLSAAVDDASSGSQSDAASAAETVQTRRRSWNSVSQAEQRDELPAPPASIASSRTTAVLQESDSVSEERSNTPAATSVRVPTVVPIHPALVNNSQELRPVVRRPTVTVQESSDTREASATNEVVPVSPARTESEFAQRPIVETPELDALHVEVLAVDAPTVVREDLSTVIESRVDVVEDVDTRVALEQPALLDVSAEDPIVQSVAMAHMALPWPCVSAHALENRHGELSVMLHCAAEESSRLVFLQSAEEFASCALDAPLRTLAVTAEDDDGVRNDARLDGSAQPYVSLDLGDKVVELLDRLGQPVSQEDADLPSTRCAQVLHLDEARPEERTAEREDSTDNATDEESKHCERAEAETLAVMTLDEQTVHICSNTEESWLLFESSVEREEVTPQEPRPLPVEPLPLPLPVETMPAPVTAPRLP